MKVQKGQLDNGKTIWLVLDDDYLPVEPISKYLRYLDNTGRSPNTVQSYARNLKLYWEFLKNSSYDWQAVNRAEISEFIHWLRNPQPGVISIHAQASKRSEKTINHALTTISCFYEFHRLLSEKELPNLYQQKHLIKKSYKPFLHHISKSHPTQTRLLKLKETKFFPGCLTSDDVKKLIEGCNLIRDKFLICLLYETGIRVGEALGLRHEDIVTAGQNEIHIVPRADNFNKARVKSNAERIVHVDKDLMKLYSDYLVNEYPEDIDSDYVFVATSGMPIKYASVDSLFRRLHKKTGIKASPHLFRHTHATELIRAGWDMSYVQKRLGHTDIQTTINTYVHLLDDDLKKAYKEYLQKREEN